MDFRPTDIHASEEHPSCDLRADDHVTIREAGAADMPRILEVYAIARKKMADSGNPTQWGDSYPAREMLEDDLSRGELHVGLKDGVIRFVFVYMPGPEHLYDHIEDGAWIGDGPYGVLHRVASDGSLHGVIGLCLEWCEGKADDIRIDTHADNKIMQHLLKKNGFSYCGIIYTYDGTSRVAFERVKRS